MSVRDSRIISSVDEIADKIRFARRDPAKLGKTVFLIGAGCSISANVPGAAEIAKLMVTETAERFGRKGADPIECYKNLHDKRKFDFLPLRDAGKSLDDENLDWHKVYDAMFRRYYCAPDDVRDLFANLVDEAQGAINWAHLCLGELVKRKFISTVLTTNFDQLVLAGLVRAGVLPVVCDGLESLNRISGEPSHPQLVELHGSRHTYLLRNDADDVAEVKRDGKATTAIQTLLHHATTFVVVGYGGREDGVMDLLVEAAKVYPNKNLFWVTKSTRPYDLSPKAEAFLATSRNSGLMLGQDADEFFLELCKSLEVGAPGAIRDPLATIDAWIAEAGRSNPGHPDIKAEIENARRRLDRFRACLAESKSADPAAEAVARIREARLAGRRKEAFDLAEAELAKFERLGDALIGLIDEAVEAAIYWGLNATDAAILERAIERSRHLAERQKHDRLAHGQAQLKLGQALWIIGQREATSDRLDEAVSVLRQALTELPRDEAPLDWAKTQNNLGNALWALGCRQSGTARLEEAVSAYRAALEERTRERVPLDWAATQNNLGNALCALGERESGTGKLEEAVAAYREALKERTRERVPLDWAGTQNNLGAALQALGERESGTAKLEEAAAAYREALKERTEEAAPYWHEQTMQNLARADALLAGRRTGKGKGK